MHFLSRENRTSIALLILKSHERVSYVLLKGSVLYFVVLSLSKQYYIFRPLSKSVGKGIGTVLVL